MLLRSVAAGDERALADLYDRHAGWLLARLRRRSASAEVDDLALQDTFLAVWRKAGKYRGQGHPAAFLWGIAIRKLIDVQRADHRRGRQLLSRNAAVDGLVRSAEDEVQRSGWLQADVSWSVVGLLALMLAGWSSRDPWLRLRLRHIRLSSLTGIEPV